MSGLIKDPAVRAVVIKGANTLARRPKEGPEDTAAAAINLIAFMSGAFSGDVEFANALRAVIGLPLERDYSQPEATEVTTLDVVEVDIDAIHRKAAP